MNTFVFIRIYRTAMLACHIKSNLMGSKFHQKLEKMEKKKNFYMKEVIYLHDHLNETWHKARFTGGYDKNCLSLLSTFTHGDASEAKD